MPATRGSWTLHEALICRWEDSNLDVEFRAFWPVSTETRYNPLHDTEARPTPPGPYCVYEIQEGTVEGHDSGVQGDTENQMIRVPVEFRIHAKSTSTRSGKAIGRDLAKKVAGAFDPGEDEKTPLEYNPPTTHPTAARSTRSLALVMITSIDRSTNTNS